MPKSRFVPGGDGRQRQTYLSFMSKKLQKSTTLLWFPSRCEQAADRDDFSAQERGDADSQAPDFPCRRGQGEEVSTVHFPWQGWRTFIGEKIKT